MIPRYLGEEWSSMNAEYEKWQRGMNREQIVVKSIFSLLW